MSTTSTLPFEAQVVAAAAGDREAFARLIDGTYGLVSSIALAIVRDVELSRDIAQDVFLAAWRDLRQIREPKSFLPWLRQITRHRAYHVLRTERRRLRRVTNAEADAWLAGAVDARPDALARLVADEHRRVLAAVLDELPDDTREVVTLFYREGQSTAQVAALLGLGEAAVRKRLSRARAALRESLLDRFGDAARAAAPGSASTAVIMAALTLGAPSAVASAATAASAGVAAKTASSPVAAGGSFALHLLLFAGSVLAAAAGGLVGVVLGTRQMKRQARFPQELVDVRRFEAVSVALVLAISAAFPLSWMVTQSPWSQVATFAAFIAGLAGLHTVWLPVIVRARHELEMIEDPERARHARARERRLAWLGWTIGIVTGSAGLLAGLWMTGGG